MVERILRSCDPSKLEPHPLSQEIYRDGPDEELIASIREFGIEQPIILAANGKTIVSGHRRCETAIQLEMAEVPCIIRNSLSDHLDIMRAIIEANRSREKTVEQKAREYKALKKIEEDRANARKKAGTPQSDHPPNVADPPKGGEARDIAAEHVGMGRTTAEKAAEVVEEIDRAIDAGDDERAEELRTELNKSVSGAHRKAKKDYGKCPNCAGTQWTQDEDGVCCAKCQHPHGEPANPEDLAKKNRILTKSLIDKAARAVCDLHNVKPNRSKRNKVVALLQEAGELVW